MDNEKIEEEIINIADDCGEFGAENEYYEVDGKEYAIQTSSSIHYGEEVPTYYTVYFLPSGKLGISSSKSKEQAMKIAKIAINNNHNNLELVKKYEKERDEAMSKHDLQKANRLAGMVSKALKRI